MEIAEGVITDATYCASPNCDERPDVPLDLIVVHSISLPAGHYGGPYVAALFCNELEAEEHPDFADVAELKVSSHLLICRDGSLVQFVPFNRRAWHAGESSFQGRKECNDFSVGIELEGTDRDRFTGIQYEKLIAVCRILCDEYDIPCERVVGHSDIAPGRKTDPGPGFDWQRVKRAMQESKR